MAILFVDQKTEGHQINPNWLAANTAIKILNDTKMQNVRTIGLDPNRFDTMQQTRVHKNNNSQKMNVFKQKMEAGLNFSFAASAHNFAPN